MWFSHDQRVPKYKCFESVLFGTGENEFAQSLCCAPYCISICRQTGRQTFFIFFFFGFLPLFRASKNKMLFVIQTLSLLSIILPVFASENRVLDAYSEANDLVLTGVWRKLHAVSVVNGETVWSSSIAVGGILLPDPSNTSFICFMHLNYTEVPPKNIPLQDNIISKTDMGFFVCADAVVNAKVATLTPRWIFPKQSNFASFSILRPNGSRALIGYADDLTFKVLSSESGELVASIDLLASFKANVDPSLTTLFCSQEYYAGKDQIVIFLCNAGVAAINITNLNDTMRDVPLGSLWWSGSHNAPIYNTLSISSDGYVVFGIRDPSNSFTALNISNGNQRNIFSLFLSFFFFSNYYLTKSINVG